MAKQKKLQIDDLGADDLDFDMGDFDFDLNPEKDNRNPAMRAASAALLSIKGGVSEPSFIAKLVKNALPSEFGTALDMTDQAASGLRDLYNTAATELKPVVRDVKRTTEKLMSVVGDKLPGPVTKRLTEWSRSETVNSYKKFDAQESMINTTLAQIFKTQQEVEQLRENEHRVNDAVRDTIELGRFKANFSQLNEIRMGVTALTAYQQNIGANFQRKSLELQYRQYFVLAELLANTKNNNERMRDEMKALIENTDKPEFIKQENPEYLKIARRNQFMGTIKKSLFGRDGDFIKNLTDDLVKRGKEKLGEFKNTAFDMIGAADMGLDQYKMAQDLGMDQDVDPYAVGGSMGGMLLLDRYGPKFSAWVKKKLEDNPQIMKGANKTAYIAANLPRLLKEYATSETKDPLSWKGKILGGAKEILAAQFGRSSKMQVDSAETLQEGSIFTRQSNRTLNEVIPGYLARIFRELQVMRTGNDKIDLTTFDHDAGRFSKSADMKSSIIGGMFGSSQRQRLDDQRDNLISMIDPNGKKLSKEDREELFRFLLRDNMDLNQMSRERLSNKSTFKGMDAKQAEKFATVFSEHFSDDDSGKKQLDFSIQANSIGDGLTVDYERIQNLINLGYGSFLVDAGLIDSEGSVNEKAILQMYLDGEKEYAGDYGLPGSRGMGGNVRTTVTNDIVSHVIMNGPRGKQKSRRKVKMNRGANRHTPKTAGADAVNSFVPQTQASPVAPPPSAPVLYAAGGASSVQSDARNFKDNNCECFDDIVKAIEKNSVKEETMQIRDMIGAIGMMLNRGIRTYTAGEAGGVGEEDIPWYDQTLSQLFRSGVRGGARAMGKAFQWVGKKRQQVTELAKDALGAAGALGKQGLEKAVKFGKFLRKRGADIMIEGRMSAIMTADMIRNGEYIDVNTGKIIKDITDITGEVRNRAGEIIMTAEQAKRAYVRGTIGVKLLRGLTKLKDAAGEMADRVRGGAGIALSIARHGLSKGKELLFDALDRPIDIYVKGDLETPVMTAIQMRGGNYVSRTSGRKVTKPSMIDGVIENLDGEVVLSEEQIKKGIVDRNGRPIRTGLPKLAELVGRGLLYMGGKLRNGLKRMSNAVGSIFGGLGDFFKGWFSPDGIIFAGGKKMLSAVEEIRDILKERLPEHRRIRKGSVEDQENRRKEKKAEEERKSGDKSETAKTGGILAGLKGLFSLNKDKEKDDEDEEDGDSKFSILGDALDYLGDTKIGRGARKLGRGAKAVAKGGLKAGKYAGKSVLGAGKMGVKGAVGAGKMGLGLASKVGLGAGAKLLGGAGAAYGAYETYNDIREGNYGDAVIDGGLTLAGLGMTGLTLGGLSATGIMGGVAAGIGAALSAPVLLGAAAVAAVGYGGYKLYKNFSNKLGLFDKLRYAQYGFLPDENEYYARIRKLEDACYASLDVDGERAAITEKNLKIKDIADSFNVDLNDEKQVTQFIDWFRKRFKPVFLTHVTALLKIRPEVKLTEVESKLTPTEQLKYLQLVRFGEGPYSYLVPPTPDMKELKANGKTVEAVYQEIQAELKKRQDKEGKKEVGAPASAAPAKAAAAGAAAGAATVAAKKPPLANTTLADTLNAQTGKGSNDYSTIGADGFKATSALLVVAGSAEPLVQTANGRIDALTAIRFKAYGLIEMEATKIQALAALENEVQKSVKLNSAKKAEWSGVGEEIAMKMATSFGVDVTNKAKLGMWSRWLQLRFLPTYLNFVTLVSSLTNKLDPVIGTKGMKAENMVSVAMGIIATTNGQGTPVWAVSFSPWPGYTLNKTISSTDENLSGLKKQMSSETKTEEKSKTGNAKDDQKSKLEGTGGGSAEEKKELSIMDRVSNGLKSGWDAVKSGISKAGDMVSNAASAVKDGVTSAGKAVLTEYSNITAPNGAGAAAIKAFLENFAPKTKGPIKPTRADRNNNPGNVISNKWTAGLPGYKGSDGRFAIFDTPEHGFDAQVKVLTGYLKKGINTLRTIISKYAPAFENDTSGYINGVAKKIGIGPDDLVRPELLPKIAAAMSTIEGFHGLNLRPGSGGAAAPKSASQPAKPTTPPAQQAQSAKKTAPPTSQLVESKPPVGAVPAATTPAAKPPVAVAPASTASKTPAKAPAVAAPPPAAPSLGNSSDVGYAPATAPVAAVSAAKRTNDGTGLGQVTDLLSQSVNVQTAAHKTLVSILNVLMKATNLPSVGEQKRGTNTPVNGNANEAPPAAQGKSIKRNPQTLPKAPVDVSKTEF